MTKLLLAGSMVLTMSAFSQTTLFQDDFESGSGSWTPNGGSGTNQWIVNSEYTGFSGLVDDTPPEPSGITGYPYSSYMHIHNTMACSGFGLCNASFDTGSSSNQPTTLTSAIDATGYSNVTLGFWYLCNGAAGSAYGTIEYSTDNGSNWTPTGTSYQGVSTWTQTSVTLPAWDNVAALKFRFRWQNGSTGNDPAFAIDQVIVTGMGGGSSASISTLSSTPNSWCFNTASNVTIAFSVTGTINSGNVYTAQLSNASGSFASPVNIGTLNSSATGVLNILGTIPAGTAVGTGYRIRVVASNPATTGTDNGNNMTVHSLPTISVIGNPANGTICPGESVTMLASGAVAYSWAPSGSLSNANQAQTEAAPAGTTAYVVTGTDANGCQNTATFVVVVENCLALEESSETVLQLYPNPVSETVYLQYDETVDVKQVEILDQSGRVIRTNAAGTTEINVSSLSPGIYQVRLQNNGVATTRFIKQ